MTSTVNSFRYHGRSVRGVDLFFILFVGVLSLTGLFSYEQLTTSYYRSNLLPSNALFDLFIVSYVLVAPATRLSRASLFFLVISTVYVVCSGLFLPPSLDGAPTVADVIVSYKPFIYLIILSFSRPHPNSISVDTLEAVFKYLLLAFLFKYLYAQIVVGIPRPGLFTENNFELVFLMVMFIFLVQQGRLESRIWLPLLAIVVVVSGSRSGFLALIAALPWAYRRLSFNSIMMLILVPLLLISVLLFLGSRIAELPDIDQVDRFVFMLHFLDEIQRFDLWNYLVGWAPMTPLSDATCSNLEFYKALFSAGNDNVCYPVILHVFYFRSILDHGLLGLVFLAAGFYTVLRSSGMSRWVAMGILLQGLINGLSVSGLANTYFALSVVLVTSSYVKPRVLLGPGLQWLGKPAPTSGS